MKPRVHGVPLLVLAAIAFVAGLAGLFRDRFEAGDIYPAYSTLRSDPMGCRALYEALRGYPGMEATRVYSQADYRDQGPGSVFLYFGAQAGPYGIRDADMKALDSLARAGNRIVLGFAPRGPDSRWEPMPEDSAEAAADSVKATTDSLKSTADSAKASGAPSGPAKNLPAAKRDPSRIRGFHLALDTAAGRRSPASALGNIQDTLPWIGSLYFDSLESPWSVLYLRDSLPVMVERPLGKGSMVLIADSYWASNEALFAFLPGRLLSLLAAGHSRLLFDERHLGLHRNDSLVDLLVKYRMHLLLPSLLLLLLAYVWKLRSAFDAPETAGAPSRSPAEPLGGAGLAGLLRRNIPAGELLGNCYSQWKETEGGSSAVVRRVDVEAGRILAGDADAKAASLIEDYRKIQGLINQRNSK